LAAAAAARAAGCTAYRLLLASAGLVRVRVEEGLTPSLAAS
jgi:hypothetical protein